MKAVLEFNLDDPDDRMGHIRCMKALDMALVLWDLREEIMKMRKNVSDDMDAEKALELVQDAFLDFMDDRLVNLDMLIN